MRVITLNLNGIRSATSKGILDWLSSQNADVILLQEVRAQIKHLPTILLNGYHAHWNLAQKPGYSGVGVLSRLKPNKVIYGIGLPEFDVEGRVIRAEFDDWTAMSVYVPSGSSSTERLDFKMRFLNAFLHQTRTLEDSGLATIIGGDFNIAHRQIDIKNWRSNQKNSGFLPEERAWLDTFLAGNLSDVYRDVVGPEAADYSWWSNRGRARANDVGWRLDYQFCTPAFSSVAQKAVIHKEPFFSDHAPVVIDYDYNKK